MMEANELVQSVFCPVENPSLVFCNNCGQFPLMQIINQKEIILKCKCTPEDGKKYEVSSIINQPNSHPYNNLKYLDEPCHCPFHEDKILAYYCFNCNVELCQDCFLYHSTHLTETMGEMRSEVKIAAIDNKVAGAKNILGNYIISKCKDNKELAKCVEENISLLTIYSDLLYAFHKTKNYPLYNILASVVNHSFKLEDFLSKLEEANEKQLKEINICIFYYKERKFKKEKRDFVNILNVTTERTIDVVNEDIYTDLIILKVISEVIIASTVSGQIVLLSVDSLEKVYSIEAHSSPISNLSIVGEWNIISCSEDKKMILWKINRSSEGHYSFEKLNTFLEHKEPISKVISLTNNRAASASMDKIIRIWDLTSPYKVITPLIGHKNFPRSLLQLKDGRIISGSREGTLFFWSDQTYELLGTIPNIYCIAKGSLFQYNDEIVLSGSSNEIDLINVKEMKYVRKLENSLLGDVSAFRWLNDKCIIGTGDNSFFQISDDLMDIEVKIKVHNDFITTILILNSLCFLSASCDATLKVWR